MTAVQQAEQAATTERRRTASPRWGRIGVHLTLIVLMIIWLLPTIGLLVNSLRSSSDIASTGWWTSLFPPSGLTLDNYSTVIQLNA